MRNVRVVLLDVELDQFPNCLEVVERVQIQPLAFENSPPGFDQGIGEVNLVSAGP